MVDDLIVGNAVPEAEQGMQMARYISLLSLPKEVPGLVINRYCGSGLEAIHLACAKINAGSADCIIAGGTESMSLVPMTGYKSALNYDISVNNPDYYLNMGLTAEKLAKKYDIKREDSDYFSFNSHMKATKAIEENLFNNEILPYNVEQVYLEKGKRKVDCWSEKNKCRPIYIAKFIHQKCIFICDDARIWGSKPTRKNRYARFC